MDSRNDIMIVELLHDYIKDRFNHSRIVVPNLHVRDCWLLRRVGSFFGNLQDFCLIRFFKIVKTGSRILERAFSPRKNVGFEGSQCTTKIEEIKNLKISFRYTGYPRKQINLKNLKIDVEEKLSTLATPKIKNLKNLTKDIPLYTPDNTIFLTNHEYLLRSGLMGGHEAGRHRREKKGYKLLFIIPTPFFLFSRPAPMRWIR